MSVTITVQIVNNEQLTYTSGQTVRDVQKKIERKYGIVGGDIAVRGSDGVFIVQADRATIGSIQGPLFYHEGTYRKDRGRRVRNVSAAPRISDEGSGDEGDDALSDVSLVPIHPNRSAPRVLRDGPPVVQVERPVPVQDHVRMIAVGRTGLVQCQPGWTIHHAIREIATTFNLNGYITCGDVRQDAVVLIESIEGNLKFVVVENNKISATVRSPPRGAIQEVLQILERVIPDFKTHGKGSMSRVDCQRIKLDLRGAYTQTDLDDLCAAIKASDLGLAVEDEALGNTSDDPESFTVAKPWAVVYIFWYFFVRTKFDKLESASKPSA
jgi:hypothetical protein